MVVRWRTTRKHEQGKKNLNALIEVKKMQTYLNNGCAPAHNKNPAARQMKCKVVKMK